VVCEEIFIESHRGRRVRRSHGGRHNCMPHWERLLYVLARLGIQELGQTNEIVVEVGGLFLERYKCCWRTPEEQRKWKLGTYALSAMIEESKSRGTTWRRTGVKNEARGLFQANNSKHRWRPRGWSSGCKCL